MILATVETMPFMITLKKFVDDEATAVFMILEVDITPFTLLVAMLPAVVKEFEFTKLVLVVEMTPFTLLVSMKLFEVVAILIRLEIVVVGTLVVETIPFIVLVSI